MSGRQLDIFKGRRQRGTQPPPPLERRMHIALADALRSSLDPAWIATHLPMGELRSPATAALLQRMYTRPGWPDFLFIGPGDRPGDNPRVFCLELKRPGGRLSEVQETRQAELEARGCRYLVTNDVREAIDTLRDLGIVRARVSA